MKKIYSIKLILLFISLVYWGCEEEQEVEGCTDYNAINYDSTATSDDGSCVYDTINPLVQFTNPIAEDKLEGNIILRVEVEDNYEITEVRFYATQIYDFEEEIDKEDDSLYTDTEAPYEFEWNSTEYAHADVIFMAIAIDIAGNRTSAETDVLIIDNRPEPVNITSIEYVWNEEPDYGPDYILQWEESNSNNFSEYKVICRAERNAADDDGNFYTYVSTDTMAAFTDRSITSCNVNIDNGMIPTRANSFWIEVTNNLGYSIEGNRTDSEIIDNPTLVLQQAVIEGDSVILNWSKSTALGPETYEIIESTDPDISTGFTRSWVVTDTTLTIPLYEDASGNETWFYQVKVYAPYGQEAWSNQMPIYHDPCVEGEVNIWGSCYDIEETTSIHRCEVSVDGCWPWQEPPVRGPIPATIGELVNLTELIVEHSPLTGSIPSEIGNLTNLTHLEFHGTDLTGEIPMEIWNLVNLEQLLLNGNQCSGELPSEIGNLTSLVEINLIGNDISGAIPPEIGNCTNLTNISLSHLGLTGSLPDEIGNLINMEDLFLRENNFTGSIPSGIGNMTQLYHLDLRDNQLSGSIPPELGNLTNLWKLNLSNNQLSGSIPSELGDMTNLFEFSIDNNQLTGSIPSSIGNLDSVGIFDLERNRLSGSIPPQIGDMENIAEIQLHGNQLTGEIPSEIGNLETLEILNLSGNELSGEIPDNICNLNLEFSDGSKFRVEYNRLCPPYPSCIEDHVGHQEIGDCD